MAVVIESPPELSQTELISETPEHFFGNLAQLAESAYRLRDSTSFQNPEVRNQAQSKINDTSKHLKRNLSGFTEDEKNVITSYCDLASQALTTEDPSYKNNLQDSYVVCSKIIQPDYAQQLQ